MKKYIPSIIFGISLIFTMQAQSTTQSGDGCGIPGVVQAVIAMDNGTFLMIYIDNKICYIHDINTSNSAMVAPAISILNTSIVTGKPATIGVGTNGYIYAQMIGF